MSYFCFVLTAISFLVAVNSINNGLGITPPLGWRSWNAYGAGINQSRIMANIHAILDKSRSVNGEPTSLADIGYINVGVDEGWVKCNSDHDYWHNDTSPNGWPVIDEAQTGFPNITEMITFAHANKLKVGWYMNCCGCAEKNPYPANEKNDVLFLRMYDLDGIKLDGCGSSHNITNWQRLINETGNKPLLTENCHNQPNYANLSWCPMNFFRASTDINNQYVHVIYNNLHAVIQFTEQYPTGFISRPGCWAYPDMLEVGNFNYQWNAKPTDMDQTHFSAWAIVSAPLILGFRMDNQTKLNEVWPLITNLEILNVSQTWGGHPGRRISVSNTSISYVGSQNKTKELPSYEIYAKPLLNGKWAVLLMSNNGYNNSDVTVHFEDIPFEPIANIRDIISHKDLGQFTNNYTAKNLPPFGSAFLVFS